MDLISLMIGIAIGAITVGLILYFYQKAKNPLAPKEQSELLEKHKDFEISLKVAEEKVLNFEADVQTLRQELTTEREKSEKFSGLLSAKNQELLGFQEKLKDQKQEIETMHEKLQIQFKNLANDILDEKTKKFTDQNKTNLSDILTPLKEKILEFEKKVEQTNKESIERNSALKEQILGLKELNLQITKEAENLTKALKGESKTQGNWGRICIGINIREIRTHKRGAIRSAGKQNS
jgi:DNA recombination protein RmuC